MVFISLASLICIFVFRLWWAMWPDWAIYWTLGHFLKLLATINLPKSLTFLGNFCKGVKIYHFSSKIIFGQLLKTFGDFFLVTLSVEHKNLPYTIAVYDGKILRLKFWKCFRSFHSNTNRFTLITLPFQCFWASWSLTKKLWTAKLLLG